MESRRWFVRTRLNRVVVYAVPPSPDGAGGWRQRGFIHQWSQHDARRIGFLGWWGVGACLWRDVPTVGVFSTETTSGRWWFVRRANGDVDLYRWRWWYGRGRRVEDFCPLMLIQAGVPELPVGVRLYLSFEP